MTLNNNTFFSKLLKEICPFLSSTNTQTLKRMSKRHYNSKGKQYSELTLKAKQCPVMNKLIQRHSSTSMTSVKDQECPASSSSTHLDYVRTFKEEIEKKKLDKSYRYFNNINRLAQNYPKALSNQKRVTVWCSNDYLGQSQNPLTTNAMKDAVDKYGTGAGGTRNIAGNCELHLQLEQELATLHSKDAALIFSSCFVANDATLCTLARKLPGCVILSDELNHASMIQGIKNSRVQKIVFKHNNMEDLEAHLNGLPLNTPKIIAFESVYSMNGSIGKIEEIIKLAKKYNAITFLDEVHAVGLYGEHGAGVAEHLNFNSSKDKHKIMKEIDIITGTLGKAYGVVGGYIAGNKYLVDMIRSYAPGFIFTTSLPPPVVAAALSSVKYLKYSSFERQMQQLNTKYLKNKLVEAGLPIIKNRSHIVPLLVGDAGLCKAASDLLLNKYNIYVQCINYPTVKVGEERLRITPSPGHTVQMANDLTIALKEIWGHLGLKSSQEWDYYSKVSSSQVIEIEKATQEIDSVWTTHQLSVIGKCRRRSNVNIDSAQLAF